MQFRREDRVKVQLKVNKPLFGYPGRPGDYYVAVTGSGLQLGYSDPKKAPRCQPIGHNLWVKDIWCLKNSDINFKFLVVKRCNGAIVDIENTQQRQLSIQNKPIIADVRFNKPRFTAKETDEQTSPAPAYKQKNDIDILSNKALLQGHLKMKSQPQYPLKGNNDETTLPEQTFPVMNALTDGLALTLRKQEESIKVKKQEEEKLKASKQPQGKDNALLTTPAMPVDTTWTTTVMTNNTAPAKRPDEDTENEELTDKDNNTFTAELVQVHQDTDEHRAKDQSTPIIAKCFPCIGKKFLLAAAGVAALSYVGYHAFFRR